MKTVLLANPSGAAYTGGRGNTPSHPRCSSARHAHTGAWVGHARRSPHAGACVTHLAPTCHTHVGVSMIILPTGKDLHCAGRTRTAHLSHPGSPAYTHVGEDGTRWAMPARAPRRTLLQCKLESELRAQGLRLAFACEIASHSVTVWVVGQPHTFAAIPV